MKNIFNLIEMQKKGAGKQVEVAIGVVVLLIIVSALAPTALIGLFNTTAFVGVPAWVSVALGSLGAIAFVYIIWRAAAD